MMMTWKAGKAGKAGKAVRALLLGAALLGQAASAARLSLSSASLSGAGGAGGAAGEGPVPVLSTAQRALVVKDEAFWTAIRQVSLKTNLADATKVIYQARQLLEEKADAGAGATAGGAVASELDPEVKTLLELTIGHTEKAQKLWTLQAILSAKSAGGCTQTQTQLMDGVPFADMKPELSSGPGWQMLSRALNDLASGGGGQSQSQSRAYTYDEASAKALVGRMACSGDILESAHRSLGNFLSHCREGIKASFGVAKHGLYTKGHVAPAAYLKAASDLREVLSTARSRYLRVVREVADSLVQDQRLSSLSASEVVVQAAIGNVKVEGSGSGSGSRLRGSSASTSAAVSNATAVAMATAPAMSSGAHATATATATDVTGVEAEYEHASVIADDSSTEGSGSLGAMAMGASM